MVNLSIVFCTLYYSLPEGSKKIAVFFIVKRWTEIGFFCGSTIDAPLRAAPGRRFDVGTRGLPAKIGTHQPLQGACLGWRWLMSSPWDPKMSTFW